MAEVFRVPLIYISTKNPVCFDHTSRTNPFLPVMYSTTLDITNFAAPIHQLHLVNEEDT